jgi:hypothetical protein
VKNTLKIALAVIVLLGAMQFFRPAENYSTADAPDDIAEKYDVPMNTLMNIYDACYNCHSNYTQYPWYYKVQPVGWWMAHHINEAKEHLNFSEFARYDSGVAAKKFKKIYEVARDRSMPLKSYLLMHEEAKLTPDQYKNVENWAKTMYQSMGGKADSLAALQ